MNRIGKLNNGILGNSLPEYISGDYEMYSSLNKDGLFLLAWNDGGDYKYKCQLFSDPNKTEAEIDAEIEAFWDNRVTDAAPYVKGYKVIKQYLQLESKL